jgi:hypothetical protein
MASHDRSDIIFIAGRQSPSSATSSFDYRLDEHGSGDFSECRL